MDKAGDTIKKENSLKVPPQSLEAEQGMLGSILVDPEAIIRVADIVAIDDFYVKRHGLMVSSPTCLPHT